MRRSLFEVRPPFFLFLEFLVWLAWLGCGLTGCQTAPKTNLAYDLFPAALVAEPIQMRAGYEHITQPFEITGPEQRWNVSLGFARRDEITPVKVFFCWVDSRKGSLRYLSHCTDDEPGIYARWELLNSDGKAVPGYAYTYDALIQNAGGTYGKAVTRDMSGFTRLPKGTYRIKVTILRDFPQLDAHLPHILVNLPFFRKN